MCHDPWLSEIAALVIAQATSVVTSLSTPTRRAL